MPKKVLGVSLTGLQAKHFQEALEIARKLTSKPDLSEHEIMKQLVFSWVYQTKQQALQTELQSEFWKPEQETAIQGLRGGKVLDVEGKQEEQAK